MPFNPGFNKSEAEPLIALLSNLEGAPSPPFQTACASHRLEDTVRFPIDRTVQQPLATGSVPGRDFFWQHHLTMYYDLLQGISIPTTC
jgi:hypothetical protein